MPFLGTLPTRPYEQSLQAGFGQLMQGLMAAKQMQSQSALSDILTKALSGQDPQAALLQGIQGYNANRPTGLAGVLDAFNPTSGGPLPAQGILTAMLQRSMNQPTGLQREAIQEDIAGAKARRGLAEAQTRASQVNIARKPQTPEQVEAELEYQDAMQEARLAVQNRAASIDDPEADQAAKDAVVRLRQASERRRGAYAPKPSTAAPAPTTQPATRPAATKPATQPSAETPAWARQGVSVRPMDFTPRGEGVSPSAANVPASQPTSRPAGKKLDPKNPADYRVMQDILRRAGNDRKKALELATQEGYTF